MNADDISAISIEIANLLRNNQSLMDTEEEIDEEEI